jgi:hypothetical protein
MKFTGANRGNRGSTDVLSVFSRFTIQGSLFPLRALRYLLLNHSSRTYGAKGALYNGTLARRLDKYAANSRASGLGTTS